MSPETTSTKLCPTCGTRLAENATRCAVCGSEFSPAAQPKAKAQKAVQGTRMPEVTLSLPVAIGLLLLVLLVGAGALYFTLKGTNLIVAATAVSSPTETPTITVTPTDTLIPTETPTLTPEPPYEYEVQLNDTCYSIAAFFDVSANIIILENDLNTNCTDLYVGQIIYVPRPTATPPPPPTATLEPAEATRAACQTVEYTVQANDTLSSIAVNYNVPMEAIKSWNGLSTDNVMLDQELLIPLCMRAATAGPSPTPTAPPPYPAPSLLLPADGSPFSLADITVTLQWASVGTLRDNERYQVTVEDVTAGTGRRLVDYANDTKFIVPVTFRPQDSLPHVMRWWVVTVRQTGTDDQGDPIWSVAGAASTPRVFTWTGSAAVPTATP
ncbi:MAG: LysM peptidoglycan-binding domain-containing protein [Chloroflexota bacterium]